MGPPGDLQVEVDEIGRLAGEELLELDRESFLAELPGQHIAAATCQPNSP